MDVVQAAFLTAVVFAVFMMAIVAVVMIMRKDPPAAVDKELASRLQELQQRQVMEALERRASEASLNNKILSLGLALKELSKHTELKSDDVLADVLIDIGTPGTPEPAPQG